MSNAAGQAARAGIREGIGDGNPSTAFAAGHVRNNPLLPNLAPSQADIIKLLQGRTILNKKAKYDAFKLVFNVKNAVSAYLNGLNAGSSASFDAVEWGETLKAAGGYSAEFLGETIYKIYSATTVLSPTSTNHTALTKDQKKAIVTVHTHVASAKLDATTKLQTAFSSQFLSSNQLKQGEYDRPYLVEGYLPVCQEIRKCICCKHSFVDEPNTNKVAVENNRRTRASHEALVASDNDTWANGGIVHNARGGEMQRGRRRNEPKYEVLILNCHCTQFGCTTSHGVVPKKECPIRCIDPSTGSRYGMNPETGECMCPICMCNDCPRFYTVSKHGSIIVRFTCHFHR